MKAKTRYFLRSLRHSFVGLRLRCPNCGGEPGSVVARKYLVTSLRRCGKCRLMYRTPTDDPQWSERFYNTGYTQGFTTDMPDEESLVRMMSEGFSGTPKDYQGYINILNIIGLRQESRLFDFGCSWGYGSWQLAKAGFRIWACEISRSRRAYAADKLGVRVVEDTAYFANSQRGSFDCFFSAHVLEHVPSPNAVISLARKLLKPGGLFVAATPNGSMTFRNAREKAWMKFWGEVHPNLLDEVFYTSIFSSEPLLVFSRDERDAGPTADEVAVFWRGERVVSRLGGHELVCVARLNDSQFGRYTS